MPGKKALLVFCGAVLVLSDVLDGEPVVCEPPNIKPVDAPRPAKMDFDASAVTLPEKGISDFCIAGDSADDLDAGTAEVSPACGIGESVDLLLIKADGKVIEKPKDGEETGRVP